MVMTYAEFYAPRLRQWRERYTALRADLGPDPLTPDTLSTWSFVEHYQHDILERVIRELDASLRGECPEDPSRLGGHPREQYYCSYCGCMCLAGEKVHPHFADCWSGLNEIQPEEPLGVVVLDPAAGDDVLAAVAEAAGANIEDVYRLRNQLRTVKPQ